MHGQQNIKTPHTFPLHGA